MEDFRNKSEDERIKMSEKIRSKGTNRLPIIVGKASTSLLKAISKARQTLMTQLPDPSNLQSTVLDQFAEERTRTEIGPGLELDSGE